MDALLRDLRYGLRGIFRSRGYALAVIITLGLGIGANTAIFSIIYGVLLKPLPYGDGERLVYLRQPQTATSVDDIGFSVHDITDIAARSRSLENVAEYHAMTFTFLGRGDAELVQTGVVSSHFFDLLGMQPILGRDFVEGDDRLGAEPVLILSYGYWQKRFGGDPDVVGQAFEMNGKLHTVIGVLPPVPQFPDENDVYMPTSACPIRSSDQMIEARDMRMMAVFGRARPGVDVDQVNADLQGLSSQLAAEYPESYDTGAGQTMSATALKEELVQNARPIFLVLLGTAGLVLLIACANVANLALARLSRRDQELALRTALGAGRGQLIRQLLTESTLLAVVGGGLGIVLAYAGHDMLVGFAARFTPRAQEATLNLPVLLFALAMALGAGLVFGTAPALAAVKDVGGTLKEGKGQSANVRRGRLQSGLVVTQVAMAFMLLIGAGLTLKSFWLLQSVDPGFDPVHVLSMDVDVNSYNSTMDPQQRRDFYFTLAERLEAMAGVQAVGITSDRPLAGGFGTVGIRAEGNTEPEIGRLPQAASRLASEGYFTTMDIPLKAGRTFQPQDADLTGLVAVVTEAFADQVFPAENPIGRTFVQCLPWSGQCGPPFEVIGVVGDYHTSSLESAADPVFFRSSRQSSFPGQTFVIRTTGDPKERIQQFRDVVKELDANIPVARIATMEDRVDEALAPRRLTMVLLTLFAGVALVVSLAGIAGVISFAVSQRTREIGIRLALGAEAGSVLMNVAGRGLAMVAVGLAVGLGGALAARSVVGGLLWGIPALDTATWVVTGAVLGVVSMLACYLPARRATRIDPLEALRAEG
jgi:putative ABC transport system permease protein